MWILGLKVLTVFILLFQPPSIEELFSVSAAMLPIFSEFGYR